MDILKSFLPHARLIEKLLVAYRLVVHLDRVFDAFVSEEAWILLLDLDAVEFDAIRAACLLHFYVLQALNWLLLHLERELFVDSVRLRMMSSLVTTPVPVVQVVLATMSFLGSVRVKLVQIGKLLRLTYSRTNLTAYPIVGTRCLDKLKRVLEVRLCVLEEVETSIRAIVSSHVIVIVLEVFFPRAVYIELAALILDRIIFFELIKRHNDVTVDFVGHLSQLLIQTGIKR